MGNDLFAVKWPRDYREKFWAAYPRKISKAAAMKSLDKVKDAGDVAFEKILEAIERYKAWLAEADPRRHIWRPEPKHPSTWLNQGCWDDEFSTEPSPQTRPTFAQIGFGR